MPLNIDWDQGHARWTEDGYGSRYYAELMIQKLSPEEIYISNLMGILNQQAYSEAFSEFKQMGFKRIIAYFPTGWIARGFKPLTGTSLHFIEIR